MEYNKLYAAMAAAAETAIAAIDEANYGQAKQILIEAEQSCEEEYNIYRQMQLNKAGTPAAHMSGGGISFMERAKG